MRASVPLLAALLVASGCGGGGSPAGHSSAATSTASAAPSASATVPAAPRPSPAQERALARVRATALPLFCAGHSGHDVALTFDDGPGPYTHYALKELRHAGARATFFLVARSIRSYPSWPRRERRLAALGDHTLTHPFLPGLSASAADEQIVGGQAAVRRAAPGPVELFRPPYGAHTPAIDRDIQRAGMVEVLWSIDSGDSTTVVPQNYAAIAHTVDGAIAPGAIVLFHENRGQTIRALRTILPTLGRRRLHAVTLPELLAADPPSAAQLREGARGCRLAGPPTSGG